MEVVERVDAKAEHDSIGYLWGIISQTLEVVFEHR